MKKLMDYICTECMNGGLLVLFPEDCIESKTIGEGYSCSICGK